MADVLSDIYDKIVAHKVKVEDVAPYYADHYAQYEKGQHWTCDSKGEKAISFAPTGMGSESACPARTITELFKEVAETKGDKIALRIEELPPLAEGDAVPGPMPLEKWKSWTFRQYYDDCRALAKAIIELGMQAHDAVNIFGFNSPEWFMANMAAILAGGKAAGIYPSDNEEQVQFKVDHSNGAVIFIENLENLNKVKEVINDVPYLKAIVTWACSPGEDVVRSDGSVVKTMKFEEILEMGKGLNDENLNARMEAQKPTHAAGLIYTSGTTGKPKAVMISHDNLIYESTTVIAQIQPSGVATKAEEERVISYLPLSHVAGMMVDIMCPIVIAATTPAWASANFARPYDLKRSTIGARLTSVEPTLFIGVPRVWEKIMEKLIAVGAQTTGLKKKLSTAAKARALETQRNLQLGGSGKVSIGFPLSNLLKLIKEKLGLAKCKFAFSGAAPMSKDCLEYFGSLNININEVYGMSECTGACTWSTDEYHTWASVGFELSGCEVKVFKLASDGSKVECPRTPSIFNAAEECQGEICFRGRNIMMGYMANDRLGEEHVKSIMKKNEEAIDSEGWLHSGDKGCIDARGMLKITGRYKELIIGAGGENIAPVPIEDNLKKLLPAISNVMMVGDKRKFNVALVTLKVEGATGELPGSDILAGAAAAVSLNSKTISEAMIDPVFIEYLKKGFDTTNANGDVVVSNASRIQKFTILPADFSVQTNELTATLKLKRSVVEEKYKDILDKMYASNDVYIPFYG